MLVFHLMNDSELKFYKAILIHSREELQRASEVSEDSRRTVELDQASVGRLSRMDAMQAQQMAQETERRRHSQIMRIEGALHRIDSGDFGYCYVCGEEIGTRRLAVDPAITRCVNCKE